MRRLPLLVLLLLVAIPAATADAAAPTVATEGVTEVGNTTVRAHGVVDPGAEEAFYRFEYIADLIYRHNVAEARDPFAGAVSDGSGLLPAGAGPVAVAPLLGEAGGLEPGVAYRLRLVAENQDGATIAVAPSFTTVEALEPIPCFGDECQILPPEPADPVLTTTVPGLGNPKVHYVRYGSKPKRHGHKKATKHKKSKRHKGRRRSSKGPS